MGKTKKIAASALVASAAGYLAGILTAPKSGKETRKDIKNTAVKAKKEAEAKLKKLHSELDELIADGKKKAAKLTSGAKKELDSAIDSAKAAKEKVRYLLSAIHEGDAEDRDLQKAIKEANKSAKHLKSFLSKRNNNNA